MGKLVQGKELRNIIRLARYFPGSNPFGATLTQLGATQIDALILVTNQEKQEEEDRIKSLQGTRVFRFDDNKLPVDDLPEEL
jgi:hypothetical protein